MLAMYQSASPSSSVSDDLNWPIGGRSLSLFLRVEKILPTSPANPYSDTVARFDSSVPKASV